MGGLLAGIENRLQAYVLIVGDGGLVTHVTNPENRTGPLDQVSSEYGAWIDAMWPIEPIHFVSHASPAPILFQNALQDQYTNVNDALRYQDVASEPKEAIWYDSEHWPLPDIVVTDNARWLQQFIGPGALFLLHAPNYRYSAIIIDRLLLVWFALTAVSLLFVAWHLRSRVEKPLRSNGWWFALIAVMGVIGLAGYLTWARKLQRKPKSV
jgi:hypothetical protein